MTAILTALAQATITGSVLICALMLLGRVAGRRIPPRWRYALWALVLICLLLPARPPSPASLLNAAPSLDNQIVALRIEEPIRANDPAPGVMILPQALTAQESPLPLPENKPHLSIPSVLFAVWFMGAIATGLFFAAVNMRFARRIRGAKPDPSAQAACDRLRREISIRKKVRIAVCDVLPAPCLVSPGRRLVLTSAALEDAATLRHVLLHELCHLKQHDLGIAWMRNLALAVHWFNPLVWLAVRAAQEDSELSCDAAVLSRLGKGEAYVYGMTLLRLIRPTRPASRALAVTSIVSSKSMMKERVHLIAKQPRKRALIAVLTLALALMLAACTLTRAVSQPLPEGDALDMSPTATMTPTPDANPTLKPTNEPTPQPTAEPDEAALAAGVAQHVDLRFFVDRGLTDNPNISIEKIAIDGRADLQANDRYQEALALWKAGKRPGTPAPDRPYQTGFAILPVRPEAYGVDKLAFLPSRPLTDEEMLQFVDGLGGKELDALTDWQVMIAGQHNETNRNWTADEMERYFYTLQDAYKYDDLRPIGEFTDDPMQGDIAHIALDPKYTNGLDEVWLKPAYTLTDDQLLSMLAYQYRDVPPERYKPGPDHLTHGQAIETADTLVRKLFDLGDSRAMPQKASFSLSDGLAVWFSDFTMADGVYDYILSIDATTGALCDAMRLPKYVPIPDPNGRTYTMTPVEGATGEATHKATDPAVAEAAADYVRTHLLADGVTISGTKPSGKVVDRNMGACSDVRVELSDGNAVTIAICLYDLSVAVVMM